MIIKSVVQPLAEVEADWLVLGLFEGDAEGPAVARETPLGPVVERLLATKDLSGGLGDMTPVLGMAGLKAGAVLVVGLGGRGTFGPGPAFDAGVALARRLSGKPRDTVAIVLPEAAASVASALAAGALVGTRGPRLRKTEASRQPFGTLGVVIPELSDGDRGSIDEALERGLIIGEAVNLARDLANTPPAEKTPIALALRAEAAARAAGVEVTVWDEPRIRQERFGGLLGVAAGSDEPPAFVILEYQGAGDTPPLALVGKGVTFDSGGLSLKPSASMEDMKSDMTGAAVVLAAIQAAARLKLPVNLVGYLAITENMTGGRALKLGDVLTMRNGKTVEVLNTDAEGRLILADALSYAAERKPARILDFATLTGACIVALGTRVAGLFGNDDAFCAEILAACRESGERAWRLPLDDDYKDLLKSTVADLKNVGGKWAGAITAAKFLEQFVGAVPWAHLDIAGPSWADSESSARDAGGTGCFVRTLIALFEALK
ncbi:MAG: leucyl aminopeptidase [Isosphaeraceae bacterium]|nr:leucyl aminopeptidase [Isosphaeraceae bacterium]